MLVISFDPTPRPVRFYCEIWGKEMKVLNNWCARGWVTGAYKHGSGEWWVRPAELCGFVPSVIESENNGQEKGQRDRSSDQGTILSKVDGKRRESIRKPI
jgi:hypothetical protein